MIVGYIEDRYPEKRTIINKINNVKYKRVSRLNNKYNYLKLVKKSIYKQSIEKYKFKFNPLLSSNIDLYHFFNHINYGNSNYITTFETYLPRIEKQEMEQDGIEKSVEVLSKANCKYIIAMSECTKNIQLDLIKNCSDYIKDSIEKKIKVIHPPQEIIFEDYNVKKKYLDNELTFIFVGNDFYRKGGYEITKVFHSLTKEYKNIKLIIIGDIKNTHDYTKKVSEDEVNEILQIVSVNDRIKYYNNLSNLEVIKLMKKSHVGMLTTWADTYGYSVLEMQASGCPVISTDVRALPEINNNNCGWIINVPKNSLGEADYFSEKSRNNIRNILFQEIREIMIEIIKNPNIIEKKGTEALNRIIRNHNLKDYENMLYELYKKSV